MVDGIQWRMGFKSKKRLPFFMIWKEEFIDGDCIYAWVVFDSRKYLGF